MEKKSPPAKESEKTPVKRRLKPEAIVVNVFGDLMKFSKKAPDVQAPFRKYDTLAVAMAEQPRDERLMMYGFLMGLALTAHARRIKDASKRRFVFETKNRLFLALANNFAMRKVLNFRLCQSKRFKVVKYCADCTRRNSEEGLAARQWKFCPRCQVDRNYYNVLSMFHKHGEGGASLFLGNDLIAQIRGLRVLKHAKFGQLGEEITFRKYTFSPKNLVALDLASVMSAAQKMADLLEKMRDTESDRQVKSYVQTGVPPGGRLGRPLTPGLAAATTSPRVGERPAADRPRPLAGVYRPPATSGTRPRGDLNAIPGLVLKPKSATPAPESTRVTDAPRGEDAASANTTTTSNTPDKGAPSGE
jgi:hypothetical protein